MSNTLLFQIESLWLHLSIVRRKQFGFLLVLMVLASFAESLSIGAVFPFLGVLTSPDRIFQMPQLSWIITLLNIRTSAELLMPLMTVFCVAVIFAGAMRLLLIWFNLRLTFLVGADLSMVIYQKTLYQPYIIHCFRNSSQVIDGVSVKVNSVIYGVVLPVFTLISSGLMLMVIAIALLTINPIVGLITFVFFGLIYFFIISITRKKLIHDGEAIAKNSEKVIKTLQEGLGGIRDILLDGTQSEYCRIYHQADSLLRRAQGDSLFVAGSPRYIMEVLGMLGIALVSYLLISEGGSVTTGIPVLGALALGAQRMLPLLQQIFGSLAQIRSNQASLKVALELLDQPLPKDLGNKNPSEILPFADKISIEGLSFSYGENMPYVINEVDFVINKGERLGLIGETGSGKSTLVDILMALLSPSKGRIKIDNCPISQINQRAWQSHIAHVPQTIFLTDSTIEENIAFGVPKTLIDSKRVYEAARLAKISDVIERMPEKYQTCIGERGVRLSGGQRQRIGIARALYKQADIIIFDEATSALDYETEKEVMEAIEGLNDDLTILIIAHRLSTLEKCSRIIELSHGSIKRIGSYQEMIAL